ncbi:MAG TPA: SchA/CurD-like domain-containing protein [Streptosporangiaceae bacterium]|nr:SchA/CurD-like domain-containing protein [Streptosporangiaceae bacterium]
MSNWHATLYPIKPGTEEHVTALFREGGRPRTEVGDGTGEPAARLLSTMVFVGPGRALRIIEFEGPLADVIGHLSRDPAARRFQRRLAEHLDLPGGATPGPAFFRDAALRPVD